MTESASSALRQSAKAPPRFAFIDWLRGLACVLMFQTHAYDSWTKPPYRQGFWWDLARMQLGGFPARIFLFLTGVSLILRYASDARKGVAPWTARKAAFLRGAEVLFYGIAYRFLAWLFAGATLTATRGLFKVDILNCIGLSLMLSSLLVGPGVLRHWRPPLLAVVVATGLVLVTPAIQGIAYPHWLPQPLGAYLWDRNPTGSFPLFPWLAYVLTGCIVGLYWIRLAERQRLGQAMALSALVGGLLAAAGQYVTIAGIYIYAPTAAVPVPAYPASYVYRTGMCLLLAAAAYWWCLKFPKPRFSPLRLLGQASLLVYFVHLELVYGRPSWPLLQHLHPILGSILVLVLTALMVAVAWWRIEVWGKRRPATAQP